MKKIIQLLLLLLLPVSAMALPVKFVEGTDYQPTAHKLAPITSDKKVVEVVEVFSYTCPHCFHLEPLINEWSKQLPANVKFVRVPAIFRDSWLQLAKVFYAAEAMGVQEKLHPLLFKAIHVEKRQLNTKDQLLDFVAEQGIDRDAFAKAMDSFAVKAKVKKALVMSQNSGITGVPTIIVNGEYMTDAPMAGGMKQMLEVVNFLIDKTANEKK